MNTDIIALFVCLDDFCKIYNSSIKEKMLPVGRKRNREGYLSLSEILFIEVLFHLSAYKDFKHFYLYGICHEHRNKFKKVPTYSRYIAQKKVAFLPLMLILHYIKGDKTGIYFVDSTPIKVCRNKRISSNKVFAKMASRSKTSMGWFFGFKLHVVINSKGQLMAVKITTGNIDDRCVLEGILKNLKGSCYADRGYIDKKKFQKLYMNGLKIVTSIKSNMKNHLMPLIDKILLRKRFIIETTFGILKKSMSCPAARNCDKAFLQLSQFFNPYSFIIFHPIKCCMNHADNATLVCQTVSKNASQET